jgi:ectoine hydroxylase-related dioxygenase (phytanoyl-CoA dioxygenase family)
METTTFDLATKYPLTADQAEQYRKDGHILLRGVATPEEIAHFRSLILAYVEEVIHEHGTRVQLEDATTLFTRVTNVWRKHDEIREIVFARRFARLAAQLMGVNGVRLYHDQVLLKDPGRSWTPWHKDHFYCPLATANIVKMSLALTDVTRETGPMVFVSGSHLGGIFPEAPYSITTQEMFSKVIRTHKIPTVTHCMNAGDAIFHSGDVLHSAMQNVSSERRESLTIVYYADATRVMVPTHEHKAAGILEFLPGLNPGDIAASELNPLLYQVSQ